MFVLADPEVFSSSLAQVLLGDIEASASASGGFLSPLDHMRSVVQHAIQAALGAEQCNGSKLAQALKVSGTVQYCWFVLTLCHLFSVLFLPFLFIVSLLLSLYVCRLQVCSARLPF